jgi:hypothetical protein
VAVIEFAGREHEVAVRSGYYLFAAWDVPYDATAVVRGARFRG